MDREDIRLRLLFGRFLEKAGIVTAAQIRQAIRLKSDLRPSLAETALVQGHLTVGQLKKVRRAQRQDGLLFEQAVRKLGLIDAAVIEALKTEVNAHVLPLGQVLVLQGVLSEDELEAQVEAFHDYNAELSAGRMSTKGAARR